ncbi:hypothetical protein DTO271G3_5347 [Paecilomyces variotii]|nr:hypothetical protein DTO271G3_5347 [Paecilomyces variotii]
MAEIKGLNAHDRPPEPIRRRYKEYQRLQASEVDAQQDIINLQKLDPDDLPDGISLAGWKSSRELRRAFDHFIKPGEEPSPPPRGPLIEDIPILTLRSVSGLHLIPSLFPPTVQKELLSRLLHRDLRNPEHKTNVHLHYHVSYPGQTDSTTNPEEADASSISFFEDDPMRMLRPKDPETHKPITIESFLNKKLRWMTLGGQYDWTAKVYPSEPPPRFPDDIAQLLRAAFPETEAQAAIVNIYSAGDTLSVHRDVSEQCDIGLISISIGCDGLFLISHDSGQGCEVIRLRSGDAVYMDGKSRFAWHGVPKVLPSTCPMWLQDWPADQNVASQDPRYQYWKGWMSGKRINLNVRQMILPDSSSSAATEQ